MSRWIPALFWNALCRFEAGIFARRERSPAENEIGRRACDLTLSLPFRSGHARIPGESDRIANLHAAPDPAARRWSRPDGFDRKLNIFGRFELGTSLTHIHNSRCLMDNV